MKFFNNSVFQIKTFFFNSIREILLRMLFFKVFILFLAYQKILAFNGFTIQNKNLISSLIQHYSIKNVFFASEELDNLEKYIEIFLSFEVKLTLNIHTNDESFKNYNVDFMECCELLFITGNNSNSFNNIFNWYKIIHRSDAKLAVIAYSNRVQSPSMPSMFKVTQIVMMFEGHTIKANIGGNSYELFTTPEEFIRTDPYEAPELYLPKLNILYFQFSIRDFPLVIGAEKPSTGLFVYFTSAFEKYYEDRRNRMFKDNSNKNENIVPVYVRPEISNSDGYPLKFSKICFALPIIDEISEPDFFKKPFDISVWILLFIFLIYFTISLRIIVIPDLFLCFYESLSCTLGAIQNGIKHKFVYLQMFVYGFIIWNLHNSKLSSYLTTPNLGRRLETVEDINEANITLWASYVKQMKTNLTEYVKKHYRKIYDYEQMTFKGKFSYSIGKEEFIKHLFDFDLSHGYLIDEIKWNFISRSQKLLKRKLFSYSEICPEYGFVYPFSIDLGKRALKEIVALFTMKIIESGLDFAWEERTYLDINFKLQNIQEHLFRPLGFQYFQYIWIICAFGIGLSVLSFCIEILVRHLKY